MKLKEYMEWKHQKKVKGGKKRGYSKRKTKNPDHNSQ